MTPQDRDVREALVACVDVLEGLRRGHGVEVSAACYPALNIGRDALASQPAVEAGKAVPEGEGEGMNYLELLKYSYAMAQGNDCPPKSPYAFLSESIFEFTTYDGDMDDRFGRDALDVCAAISDRTTFEYIKKSDEHYRTFILMCNMPFFAPRLEWGASMRGAWWAVPRGESNHIIESCGLWVGDRQLLKLVINPSQWDGFIRSMREFAERPC